jgi:hypothetical protein
MAIEWCEDGEGGGSECSVGDLSCGRRIYLVLNPVYNAIFSPKRIFLRSAMLEKPAMPALCWC